MRTAQIGLFNILQYFHVPVGYPWPADGNTPANNHIQNWLKTEGKTANSYQKTSYGTYVGLGTLVIGAITGLVGLAKDNKFCKFIGIVLAGVGVVASLVGKFCGFDFDLSGKINNKVLFNPPKNLQITPEQVGLKDSKEIKIDLPDGECLHGYFLPSPVETTKTVIYLHGRANNISHCLEDIKKLQSEVPVNVLMMDYRGFGKSVLKSSAITHDSVVSDAIMIYDFLQKIEVSGKRIQPEDTSLFGHSLGGAVAIELATKRKVRTLIVQSSFTSIKDIIEDFRTKGRGASLIQKIVPESLISCLTCNGEFNSLEMIKKVMADNICIGHGLDDPLIGAEHSEKLCDVARKAQKGYVHHFLFEKAGHSDFSKHYTNYHFAAFRRLFGVDELSPIQKELTSTAVAQ